MTRRHRPSIPGAAGFAGDGADEAAAALWAEGTPPGRLGGTAARSPEDRLGWVDLPLDADRELPRYRALRDELLAEGFERLVVAAMGGSALAPKTLAALLPRGGDGLELQVLNGLAPEALRPAIAPGRLPRTVFLVASKSGTTVETMALESLIVQALGASGGSPRRQLMALSDPGSPLLQRAASRYRRAFPGRADVGGRFSALCAYGLLPAVLAGCELESGLAAARRLRRSLDAPRRPDPDPGFALGVMLARLHAAGRFQAKLSASSGLAAVLPWLEQMFAETTGKQGKGILPVVLPSPPAPPARGPGVFRIHLGPAEGPEAEGLGAEAAAGVPVIRDRPGGLLETLFRWQVAVTIAAFRIGVDPYDQPDVEGAKAAARRLVGDPASAQVPPADPGIAGFLAESVRSGLAINAFGHPSEAAKAALCRTQREIAARFGVVPALGFGSALLHSIGQIEKGGPPDLGVLMLSWAPEEDLPIPPSDALPAAAAGLGAGRLVRLQAAADYEDLRRRGRRVLWLDAEAPGEQGLSRLLARVAAA